MSDHHCDVKLSWDPHRESARVEAACGCIWSMKWQRSAFHDIKDPPVECYEWMSWRNETEGYTPMWRDPPTRSARGPAPERMFVVWTGDTRINGVRVGDIA